MTLREHGVSGYNNHKCRCEVCRAAAAWYRRVHVIPRAKRKGQCINCAQPAVSGRVRCEKHAASNLASRKRRAEANRAA